MTDLWHYCRLPRRPRRMTICAWLHCDSQRAGSCHRAAVSEVDPFCAVKAFFWIDPRVPTCPFVARWSVVLPSVSVCEFLELLVPYVDHSPCPPLRPVLSMWPVTGFPVRWCTSLRAFCQNVWYLRPVRAHPPNPRNTAPPAQRDRKRPHPVESFHSQAGVTSVPSPVSHSSELESGFLAVRLLNS